MLFRSFSVDRKADSLKLNLLILSYIVHYKRVAARDPMSGVLWKIRPQPFSNRSISIAEIAPSLLKPLLSYDEPSRDGAGAARRCGVGTSL